MKLFEGFPQENYSKTALKMLGNCSETALKPVTILAIMTNGCEKIEKKG